MADHAPFEPDDYLGKITSEHRGKPRFSATVEANVSPIADAQAFLAGIPEAYDLDTAIGAQLDVVGEWVGISRKIQIPLVSVWFSVGIAGLGVGEGIWKGPYDPTYGIASLDDDTYRDLIRLKIKVNTWDGLVGSAQAAVDAFYGGVSGSLPFVEDGHDMTMTVCISGNRPATMRFAIFAGRYVQFKPAAVTVRSVVPSIPGPVFGIGVDNEYIAGVGAGSWAVDAEGVPGVPYRITIGGVVYERVLLDGTFVEIDGLPLYMEI